MTDYRVVAPVVIAKTMTPDGIRWIHIQQGGTVPPDVEQSWIDGHLEIGMIAPVPGTEPPPAPPADHPAQAETKTPARGRAAPSKED